MAIAAKRALCVALSFASVPLSASFASAPTSEAIANHWWQCDRQCRRAFGFYEQSITGTAIEAADEAFGLRCACTDESRSLGELPFVETEYPVESPTGFGTFKYAVQFNTHDFWGGQVDSPTTGPPVYSTTKLCALNASSPLEPPQTYDMPAEALEQLGLTVLHCGACAACSSLADVMLLYETRRDFSVKVSECSVPYVTSQFSNEPQSVAQLKSCFNAKGLTFSDDGSSWQQPAGLTTCMDCFVDNIHNTFLLCGAEFCSERLGDPSLPPSFYEEPCTQCDEYTVAPVSTACTGAIRRAMGVNDSDIVRGPGQICDVGVCYDKGDACFQ